MYRTKEEQPEGIVCRLHKNGTITCEKMYTTKSEGIVCRLHKNGTIICEKDV